MAGGPDGTVAGDSLRTLLTDAHDSGPLAQASRHGARIAFISSASGTRTLDLETLDAFHANAALGAQAVEEDREVHPGGIGDGWIEDRLVSLLPRSPADLRARGMVVRPEGPQIEPPRLAFLRVCLGRAATRSAGQTEVEGQENPSDSLHPTVDENVVGGATTQR